MEAANCIWFCLNPFCHEVLSVHEDCLPHHNNDLDKTKHNLQLTSAWITS